MKVKFVYDGVSGPRNNAEVVVDMKTLPHEGDRLRLVDGVFEIVSITHTPGETEFVAVATIRAVQER